MKYDVIYHLAAWTQAGDFASKFPGSQWINNQLINTNVLTWWKEFQSQAFFVSIGTSCSYADGSQLEEAQYLDGLPHGELLTYGFTKRMLFIGQTSLQKEFGLKSLVAVPATLYGCGYEINNRQPHFIFDLVKKLLNFKYKSNPIEIWGDGKQKRELVLVDDFIDSLLKLVEKNFTGIINIGSGEEFEINYYLNEVAKICSIPHFNVIHKLDAHIGVLSKKLSIVKLKENIPEFKVTPLNKGLEMTIKDIENRFFK